jgi:hypothetical protein
VRAAFALSAAAAALLAFTGGASSSSGAWAKCGPRFTFLIWPHGHPALPKIGFPNLPNPHVEAYIDFGDQWPDARAGGYIIGGKGPAGFPQGGSMGPCLNYGASLSTGTVANGVTITRQTAVECTFATASVIDIVDLPGKREAMIVHAGRMILARADASPTSASLTVPTRECRTTPSPGNPPASR